MAMPEASMDEDDLAPAGENQIGAAGKIATMKTITVAVRM
jgi:hypothetical protein